MWAANGWKDYEIIDASCGERLERWGNCILIRPDPQVIWKTPKTNPMWRQADAVYHRSGKGGGSWEILRLPNEWTVSYGSLTFRIKPFSFKHTGLFPEQSVNWDWMRKIVRESERNVKVLNLFAYTGGATLSLAQAGASVTHVDASKGMVGWARENAAVSGLADKPIRWLVDDCKKFVEREIRRGSRYDAIIMDPPSYGRGPKKEIWKLEDSVYELILLCEQLLSDKPLFFVINSYTTGLSSPVLSYLLCTLLKNHNGVVEADDVGLYVKETGLPLPCGSCGRWLAKL